MNDEMKKSITRPSPLTVKIAIATTFINSWIIFEETVVDRTRLWHYMPFYRVGLFCTWDVLALAVILAVAFLRIAPTRSSTPWPDEEDDQSCFSLVPARAAAHHISVRQRDKATQSD
jgi:hypothetical protein